MKPDMSREERLIESLLLKVRWQQVQKGMDRKHIKLHSNKIYIQNKLYGEVINSQFVLSQSQQPSVGMDTSSNN